MIGLHSKYQSNSATLQVSVFESLAEYVDNSNESKIATDCREAGRKFVGRDMASEPRRKAIQAYQPGMNTLDECRDECRDVALPQPKTRSRRARFDEFDGDDICLDRLRSGAPFWRTTRREETAGPQTVTLAIDVAANWKTPARAISWRGMAGILVAELLEAAGVRVELWAVSRTADAYENGDGRIVAVKVKASDAPLDTVALVNSTAGWFFRSFIFESLRDSPFGETATGHLGIPKTPDKDEVSAATGVEFDAVVSDCLNKYSCLEIVRVILKRFGAVEA